jgi:hypothetical protein
MAYRGWRHLIRGWRHFKNSVLFRQALLFLALILTISLFVNNPIASSIVRTNSSLLNIDWGMSPEQVLYATKEYSRDTELIEDGERAILIQRERITDSDIAAKSEVLYSFKNGQLYNDDFNNPRYAHVELKAKI